jgi:hypothetical protein
MKFDTKDVKFSNEYTYIGPEFGELHEQRAKFILENRGVYRPEPLVPLEVKVIKLISGTGTFEWEGIPCYQKMVYGYFELRAKRVYERPHSYVQYEMVNIILIPIQIRLYWSFFIFVVWGAV